MTYVPALFNKFIGDDHLLIEHNVFYSSLKNVPRLFEQGVIAHTREFFSNSHDYGSGAVSYRPVLSLTYFIDYGLWGHKPFGFHLTNILIHVLNCVLLYTILLLIFKSYSVSLLSAFLFGLHPLQTEAVAVIGYRADVLAALFVLSSFYCWLKFREGNGPLHKYYGGALIMYFLAVFTKESSVMLPVVILCYDQLLVGAAKGLKARAAYYAGFVLILFFYLYIYIFVFPNSSLGNALPGASSLAHFLTAVYIGYSYILSILTPWAISLLPGEYCPPPPAIFSWDTFKMAVLFLILTCVFIKLWREFKPGAFFLLWFVIFYIPVSNLIPLANPMAYRFMYLPSAGFLTVCALGLYNAFSRDLFRRYSVHLASMFYAATLLVCMLCTVFLIGSFKSDFDVAYSLIEHYPQASRGYAFMGQEYFIKGLYAPAAAYFEKAYFYGNSEPQLDLKLGICYFHLRQWTKAKELLLKVVALNPDFLEPYLYLWVLEPNDPSIYAHLKKAYLYGHLSPQKTETLKKILFPGLK